MSAFSDALNQDVEREITSGDFAEEVVRRQSDGSQVTLTASVEYLDERIEDSERGEVVVQMVRVTAPQAHQPVLEEAWTIGGVRYAVKRVLDTSPAGSTFEAEHSAPRRKHSRQSYNEG